MGLKLGLRLIRGYKRFDTSIVDEEGELFYAGEDEVAILDVKEQEYRDIFGESDINESDFNGF